ncbi:MAG: ABC transporter ATP-binding protein [Desulforhopalus sp.]
MTIYEQSLIDLEAVTKIYNQGEANEVTALKTVSMSVARGEMVCVQGPSGSGKTTLLSIIGCIFSPTSGRATIGGKKISRLPDHFLTRYRRELIGFVFQNYNMVDHLTVLENVTLPLMPLGESPRARERKADRLLEKFGIIHRKKFAVNQLSGGELQRVAIARSLINDPPIIVADEPTAHLDRKLSLEVVDMLVALKGEGRTVIVTSHDPIVSGHLGMDRIIEVRDGEILSACSEG